jgi:hypothetical protein
MSKQPVIFGAAAAFAYYGAALFLSYRFFGAGPCVPGWGIFIFPAFLLAALLFIGLNLRSQQPFRKIAALTLAVLTVVIILAITIYIIAKSL